MCKRATRGSCRAMDEWRIDQLASTSPSFFRHSKHLLAANAFAITVLSLRDDLSAHRGSFAPTYTRAVNLRHCQYHHGWTLSL